MYRRKNKIILALVLCMVISLAGCNSTDSDQTTEITAGEQASVTDADGSHAVKNNVTLTTGSYSDKELDDSYDEDKSTLIQCNEDKVQIDGSGASADGQTVTISTEGTYILKGTLADGQIIVNAAEKNVQLVFDGIQIDYSASAPIYIEQAKNTYITLAENTENYISDGSEYATDSSEDAPTAAIYSKDDLTFNGSGSLEVVANYNNAIQSKDDLTFISGVYHITSVDDGIVGKDSVSILDGTYTIESQSDGIKSTNNKESDKGYIMIDGGDFTITAENDGIQAETLLHINDGTFDLITGGGYENGITTAGEGDMMSGNGMRGGKDMDQQMPQNENQEGPPDAMTQTTPDHAADPTTEATDATTSESYKGLKSYVDVLIENGTFSINSADDAIHSNNNVTIENGTYTINAGDDAMHADQAMTINDGEINVPNCYEGIEGCTITINDGTVTLTANDDGMNSVNGNDESDATMGGMDADDGSTLTINGGDIKVMASGDGLDSNGSMSMTGGILEIQGPTNGGNGSFDYNGTFTLTGGTVFACGSSQMAQTPSDDSAQGYLSENWSSNIAAGTTISISNQSGNELANFTTAVESQWFCISSSKLESGETYVLNVGGTDNSITAK
ncbi:MAG: carbohydrate-binding domain-containing protein [Hespellia sp.]|nr:carbohydrate-binding domain-containing protein [Hespellia sp.]